MNDFIEIRHIFSVLLRRWWLLLLAMLLAGGLGYGFSQVQEPIYKATASMAVDQVTKANALKYSDIEAISQLIRTYADIVIRQPLLERVVQTLALAESWQQLRERVRAVALENSQVLEISVEASSREDAVMIANQIAQQLLFLNATESQQNQRQTQSAFAQSRLDEIEQQIQAGQEQLHTLKTVQASTVLTNSETALWNLWINPANTVNPLDPSGERASKLGEEIARVERLIIDWERSYDRWKIIVQENSLYKSLTIVEPAQASLTPVRPRTQLNVMLASGIGLALALCLVILLEHLDDTIKASEETAQLLQTPIIGSIRRIKGEGAKNKLLLYQEMHSRVAEDYQALHNKIQMMGMQTAKTLLVTSPNPSEGRSTLVANLGVVMAQAGYRTIIIDADWRQSIQHEFFQISGSQGLQQLLSNTPIEGDIPLWTINRYPNLSVLTSGNSAMPQASMGKGAELAVGWWRTRRMSQVFAQLLTHADIILVDSPPLLSFPDVTALSEQVDGVIVVLEANRTKCSDATEIVSVLRQGQANLMGVVLNQAPVPVSSKLGSHLTSGRGSESQPAKSLPATTNLLTMTAQPTGMAQPIVMAPPLTKASHTNGSTKHASSATNGHQRVALPLRSKHAAGVEKNGAQTKAANPTSLVTFEQLGIATVLLHARVDSVTLPLAMKGEPFTGGEQMQLEILLWLGEQPMMAEEALYCGFLDIEWDNNYLGVIALEKNGAQSASFALPPQSSSSGGKTNHCLQVRLRSSAKRALSPDLVVVIRPTSHLILPDHHSLTIASIGL